MKGVVLDLPVPEIVYAAIARRDKRALVLEAFSEPLKRFDSIRVVCEPEPSAWLLARVTWVETTPDRKWVVVSFEAVTPTMRGIGQGPDGE